MDRICPLLGLAGDRRAAVDGVDAGHRCHAEDPPAQLDRGVQSQLCLAPAHERCERLLAFMARTGTANPGRSSLGDGFVSTRLVLAPQPAWRGIAGRARASRTIPVLAAGVGIAAVGLAGVTVASGMLADPPPDTLAASVPPPTATATPQPSPSPSSSPTATLAPTAPPTPTPVPATPVPTPVPATPVPTPVPQRTYTVVEGDTLAVIAERFGTTTAALQDANGIEDPNEIFIGQVLVIP